MNLNKEIQEYLKYMYTIDDYAELLMYCKRILRNLNDICRRITDDNAKHKYIETQRFIIDVTNNYINLCNSIKEDDKD
nr:MAG TPA: hypothetical protein [Caudoviricetes sp.]